ncbi:MAG: phosphate ABC transporter permease subunit PstC, partial [Bacteroidaceae bacterium]|nr:phosphate ABC transporter permease subunit PstC [Bacteroidaceae bacterium]
MNDKIYRVILFIAALIIPVVCGGVIYALVTDAYEAFEHFGFFKFLTSSEWSYTDGAEQYGALPFITGTLMTTLL